MSKTSKLLDQYLFAPDRYLDYHGNIVDAGRVKNFISQPSTKIAVFVGVALATGLAATDNKNLAQIFLIAAGAVSISMGTSYVFNSGNSNIYFDTNPDKKIPLDPALEVLFANKKNTLPLSTATSIPVAMGISSGILYVLGINTTTIAISASLSSAYMIVNGTSEWWRVSQALNGEWNASIERPKPQRQEVPEPLREAVLAPVPSR